jgi:hypothetical protein
MCLKRNKINTYKTRFIFSGEALVNSKLNQKLLVLGLIISLCFLAACGQSSSGGNGSVGGQGGAAGGGATGGEAGSDDGNIHSTACYVGANNDNKACVALKTIQPSKEGYKNPYTDPSFMASAKKEQYRMPVQGVNLVTATPNLKIAPNFKLSELMSLSKGNFGIFSPAVLKIIQKLRDQAHGALKINSGFRSPTWNAGVDGSATWSRHQYGDAVDIASPSASLDQLVALCKSLGATYVDKYVVHVHCDWRNMALEPSFFGAVKAQNTLSTDSEEEKINTLSELTNSSQIKISGNIKAGNIVRLSSTVTYKEDTEELFKKWVIFKPNGDQMTVEQAEVSLPLQKGVYQVVHYIGENITLNKSFIVN